MTDPPPISDISLTHRVLMLAMAELSLNDETPAYSFEIRATSREYLTDIEADVVGELPESIVMRSLNELVASDLLTEDVKQQSSVGKGRQTYELAVPADTLLGSLADDEYLSRLVADIRES